MLREAPRKNFHKEGISLEKKDYTINDKNLLKVLQHAEMHGYLDDRTTVFLPFRGPGSMVVYFDYQKIPTVGGDIVLEDLINSRHILNESRHNFRYSGVTHEAACWDALALPIRSGSQQLAFACPPFNVNCKTETDPLELAIGSLVELKRVLKVEGAAYYLIPQSWLMEFMARIEAISQLHTTVVYDNISGNVDSKLPLALTCSIKLSS